MGLTNLIRNSFFYAALRVVNAVAVIFLAEYIISTLSVEQYGQFSSYVSLGLIFSAFIRLGFDRELVRKYKTIDDVSQYYCTIVTIVVLVSFLFVFCSIVFFREYWLVSLLGGCLAVGVVAGEKIRMANGIFRYSLVKGFDYSVGATLFIVWFGTSLVEYEYIYLLCAAFYALILLIATGWRPRIFFVSFDCQQGWIFANTIVNVLLGNFMILYLSWAGEDALAGLFRYLVTWTAVFSIAQQSILAAAMRDLSFSISDNKPIFPALKRIWLFTVFVALFGVAVLLFVVNSPVMSYVSVNLEDNADGLIFMFSIMAMNFAFGPLGYILHLAKMSKYLLVVNVSIIIVTIISLTVFQNVLTISVVLAIYGASLLLKNLCFLWRVYATFSYRLS